MKKVCLRLRFKSSKTVLFDDELGRIMSNAVNFPMELKKAFNEKGYDIATQTYISEEEADICIYADVPFEGDDDVDKNKSYLLLQEGPAIIKENWDIKNHRKYRKVFTWSTQFENHDKYIHVKLCSGINIHPIEYKIRFQDKKLCTMIAYNKISLYKAQLYSERVKAIDWFTKNAPKDFEFYGFGWDEISYAKNSAIARWLLWVLMRINSRVHFFSFRRKRKHCLYKGSIDNKAEVLSKYRFSITYENNGDMDGYITEKIFDCFLAGCVPIYLGAPDVQKHIPSNCFIDKRDFKTYKELYNYISNMSEEIYNQYLDNINSFLRSEQAQQFDGKKVANVIVDKIMADVYGE